MSGRKRHPGDLQERKSFYFWEKVNRDGPLPAHAPELGPCWVWTASTLGKGYGAFCGYKCERIGAHRFAWQLANGRIPAQGAALTR